MGTIAENNFNRKDIQKRQQLLVQKLTANIFSRISYKITFSNKKANQSILAIDLLKDGVKKDLLSITSQNVENFYSKLLTQPSPDLVMKNNGVIFFQKLVKKTCDEFLLKQYGCNIYFDLGELVDSLYFKTIIKDLEILFQVPFSGLIDPKDPQFLSIYYPVYSKASEPFIEALLDNLIIEISNCVVYFTVINFSSIYLFRQTIYRSKFLSLRNLERFKNNLNWQLYFKVYVQRPLNLYNNRHDLYVFKTTGIYCRVIYANRSNEIASLKNLPLLVIVLIEFGDFVTSRVDETIFIITKSLRFTLTSVLGQFIGLIWRGIIEGLKK
jgi:hypothetical protein